MVPVSHDQNDIKPSNKHKEKQFPINIAFYYDVEASNGKHGSSRYDGWSAVQALDT